MGVRDGASCEGVRAVTEDATPESPELVGALKIGGTHVASAMVNLGAGQLVPGSVRRRPLDPHGSADELLNGFASAIADAHAAADAPWGVAIPGPCDYSRGIGLFKDVGNLDALLDVNLTARPPCGSTSSDRRHHVRERR